MITPAIPESDVQTVRQGCEAAIMLLTGDVMDGQWLGKDTGTTYMLLRTSDVELIRTRLYQALELLP